MRSEVKAGNVWFKGRKGLNAPDVKILKALIEHEKLDYFEALPLHPFETDIRSLYYRLVYLKIVQ